MSPFARALVLVLGCTLAPVAAAATYAFIVAGLGGEPEYEQRFREQAAAIADAARRLAGNDSARVALLTGKEAQREAVQRELQAFAGRMTSQDAVMIVLIGHGSFDGEEYRFNVPGPDLTAAELAALFDRLPAGEQLILNATSASGAVLERWQRPGRVVVTATKSAGERTATRFARYWAEAVSGEAADLDRNGIVTASEAFEYANLQVAAAFKADVALATEHARLEGENAAHFEVARLGPASATDDPAIVSLLARRSEIERDLDAVKARRSDLQDDEYYAALEGVLVRLALLQREIDARQAGGGG